MKKTIPVNGNTQSNSACSAPADLVVSFGTARFNEILSGSKIHMVIANEPPTLGKPFDCRKMKYRDYTTNFSDHTTSKVVGAEYLGNNVFLVTTHKGLYIVGVDKVWLARYVPYAKIDYPKIDAKVYMAIANEPPALGKPFYCRKINYHDNTTDFYTEVPTSRVVEAKYLGKSIYMVITLNSLYFVKVG